jgi:hypothetical protein
MPTVALRATDKIQRDIEEYFLQHGLYYERRKNHYQNEGKPIARIVTVPYLAEAVLAVLLNRPHLGQPRLGGGFLRSEELYREVFDASIPLSSYLQSFKLAHAVDKRIYSRYEGNDKDSKRNRRGAARYTFPTAMIIAVMHGPLEDINVEDLPNGVIDSCQAICGKIDASRQRWRGRGGADNRFGHALLKEITNPQEQGEELTSDPASSTSTADPSV